MKNVIRFSSIYIYLSQPNSEKRKTESNNSLFKRQIQNFEEKFNSNSFLNFDTFLYA